jgi:predicted ATPase
MGLKVAACLGSTFDLAVFQKANKSPENNTEDFVSLVTENGFIHELAPNQFTWSHDQLQQAAYSLIPKNMRESTHLLVGARIYLSAKDGELISLIHDIVRNMNIGIALLDSQDRKTELAQLNLMAGEQSQKSSAFYSAANYFMTGIGLLDENWQTTSYELAMKLFNSA